MNRTLQTVRRGMMGAILFAVQIALSRLPNFEMVTLLIILMARVYGKDVFYAVAVFNLCELVFWGWGTWWVSYLYVWNLLAALTLLLKDRIGGDSLIWAAFSAVFGLAFGALFAIAYIPVSFSTALGYWTAGLPFDILHGIGNFVLMLTLYKPLTRAMESSKK